MNKPFLSIVIPAYNEANTLADVLENVFNSVQLNDIQAEVLLIDDASTDGTVLIAEKYQQLNPHCKLKIHTSKPNRGKGFAIRKGIENATGDFILIQDADHEYDPRDYALLVAPVKDGFADVVYGSRFSGGNPHRILFFWHSIGNKLLTFLSNMFTNLNLTDMESGYKLMRRSILQTILLKENRFGFEPEVTAKLSRVPGIRFYEVGISYYGRTYAEGKKINWQDGFKAIWCILKYNLFSKR